jgi:hypothetical protein
MGDFAAGLDATMALTASAMGEFGEYVAGLGQEPSWTAKLLGMLGGVVTFLPIMIQVGTALISALKGGGGGDGIDVPDGKSKPKGPDGKPRSKVGKVFDAAKNLGSKALRVLPGLGTTAAEAATVAAPGATAATSTAAGATSLLGKGAGMALKAAKFLGPAGMIANAGYGAFQGYQNTGANFDLQQGQQATAGQKASSTLGGLLSNATFGLLSEKTAAQGVHGVGSSVGNFFSKAASGVGNVVSGGASLIGGGISALAGKAGLGSGYSPTGGQDPKVFLEAQKANNDKLVASMKDVGDSMKSSNKATTDMAELLKSQLAKQDEMLTLLQDHLGVSQSLLTQAQS